MTREDFKILAKAINTMWPDTIFSQASFDLWYGSLSDMSYEQASFALQRYISTSEFAPKPASLRKQVAQCIYNVTPQEAWSMVYKAICNSSYYAEEEFAKLPPDVQRAVGGPERLRELAGDSNFNAGVESSNFMRTYSELAKQHREESTLPEALRLAFNKGAEKLTDGMGNV